MNEFCKNCPDKRGEDCRLPGRFRLVMREIGEIISGMGAAYAGSGYLSEVDPRIGETELEDLSVVACIEMHKDQQAKQDSLDSQL
jgi:hypothetical protein